MSPTVALLIVLMTSSFLILNSLHQVNEGHVGVYWRGGKLLNDITTPGLHLKLPFLDHQEEVQVTMQTDSVKNIACGTSGGVLVSFEKIEVVNRLRQDHVLDTIQQFGVEYDKMWIFDKIHHEINQFCSRHTLQQVFIDLFDTLDEALMKALQSDCDKHNTGIDIVTVRVTKPIIPESVRIGYEKIESERKALVLAKERFATVQKEAQTAAEKARIDALREKEVRIIALEKEVLEAESEKKMSAIRDEMHLSSSKAAADAKYFVAMKEAEANKMLFTEEYFRYLTLSAIVNNTKIYFGEKIPSMITDNQIQWSKTP